MLCHLQICHADAVQDCGYLIVNIEEESLGTFRVDCIKLFRGTILRDEEEEMIVSYPGKGSFKTFNIRGLDGIAISFEATYSQRVEPQKEIEINLYNETGLLLKQHTTRPTFFPKGATMIANFDMCFWYGIEWKKGLYVIEFKFNNEIIAVTPFKIGNKGVPGEFTPHAIESEQEIKQPFDMLNSLIGLNQVKEQMNSYRQIAQLATQRQKCGLKAPTPILHAIFMGNPGTGKTTVAKLYGAMLKELGLLSSGHVVMRERSTLTGPFYSNEESKTLDAIGEAQGGILFIDEAYTLYRSNDPKDPGRNVIETLLTALSDENNRNWALLLAGYPEGMSDLLNMNPGFSSRIPERNRYHFDDYTANELIQIAESYCTSQNYFLSKGALKALRIKINHDYQLRDEKFGNARYITTLLTTEVLPAMASRLAHCSSPSLFDMLTIQKEDIPSLQLKDYQSSLQKLHNLVGMTELKKSIESHLNMVKLLMLRNEQGIETNLPPMHMVFTGNPGTGKTTVAEFIGEIYASLGLLSKGKLIYVERKDMIGQYLGDTEKKMKEILNRAKGNVLFIDEAYTLAPQGVKEDYGPRALEVLLSTLSKERIDMLVILAGYPEEMKNLLQSNRGLTSRIPYTFHFPDYTCDELMQIADMVAKKSHFHFSAAARQELQKLVEHKLESKDEHWGNARFITRLISAHIIPAMSNRLAALPIEKQQDKRRLSLICREDIPSKEDEARKGKCTQFNEAAVQRALNKLDALVGLESIKSNIHNYVQVMRYALSHGKFPLDNEPLRWNFTGNTGTGKSTVASILGDLLKAMNLLEKGHLVEIKAEELCHISEYKADEVLCKAMQRSKQGLLFIDGDAPLFKQSNSYFNSNSLRLKLSSITLEHPHKYALIIAENEGDNHLLNHNLRQGGVPSFDHTLHFEDYTETELLAILESCLQRKQLHLSPEASAHMSNYIQSLCAYRKLGYANARTMSKLAHAIADTYLLRISSLEKNKSQEVLLADVEKFVWREQMIPKRRIGFI